MGVASDWQSGARAPGGGGEAQPGGLDKRRRLF